MDDRNHLLKDWYLEFAVGSVSNRGIINKAEFLPKIIQANKGREFYRSMFLYDESVNDYVKENNSISNFKGIKYINTIILDIDLKGQGQGDKTIEHVLELVDVLNGKGIGNELINIWFSGTGFHIHIPNVYQFEPSSNLDKIVRASIKRDFGDYVDIIYDATRLIRIEYSKNLKTGLFKNPFKIHELQKWDYEYIAERSKTLRTDYQHPKVKYDNHQILKPMDISRKNIQEVRKVYKDTKAETSRYITCAQHIYNAGHQTGQRHHYLLRIASIAISKWGYDAKAVQAIAKAFNEKSENPLPADEVSKVVADCVKVGGYRYPCNDEILSKYCDSKCVEYRYKSLEPDAKAVNAQDMIANMIKYAQTDFTEKSFDLKTVFPFLPESHLFKTGDLVILAGDTKLGKTALYQHIITNTPNVKTLFLSLEVDEITMTRRFMQQMLQKNKYKTLKLMADEDEKAITTLEDKLSHMTLLCESPDITQYKELIDEHKPRMVVIDTIDMVPAKWAKNDEYEKMNYVIPELKKFAMQSDIILLGVSHISKSASARLAEGGRLDIHDLKGNSIIEQKADKIIGFEGDRENNRKRIIRTLGSRDESMFHMVCNFNWETFTFAQRK